MSDPNFQLDPNRHAQPAEWQVLKANLALDTETLETLKTRTAKAAAIVSDAEQKARMASEALESARSIHKRCAAQQYEVQERINYARGLMHPIRRFPDELLQAIMLIEIIEAAGDATDFESAISESGLQARRRLGRLPYCLAAVSRTWRRVATNSPALWIHIVLNFEDIYATEGWTPIKATEALNMQLARTAKKGLILLVDADSMTEPSRNWFLDDVWTPNILRRLIHLQMGRISDTILRDLRVNGVGPSRLLTAEFYNIQGVYHPSVPSNLFHWMAPSITPLRCDDLSVPWSSICPLPALRAMASRDFNTSVSFEDLSDLAHHAPKMTQLDIRADLLGDDRAQFGTIEFNEVQHLSVIACVAGPVCRALRFPKLIAAELCAHGQVNDACALLLQHGVASFETNHLRSLSLRSTDATGALARVFYELKLVEDLTMYSGQHTKEFCALMSKQDGRGRWALPRLNKLDIQDHCLNIERPAKLLQKELLQMISQRQEISRDHTSGLATLIHCDVSYSSFVDGVSNDFDVKLQHAIYAGL